VRDNCLVTKSNGTAQSARKNALAGLMSLWLQVAVLSSKQARKNGRLNIVKSAHGRQPISQVRQGITPDALRKKDLDTLKRLDELTVAQMPAACGKATGSATVRSEPESARGSLVIQSSLSSVASQRIGSVPNQSVQKQSAVKREPVQSAGDKRRRPDEVTSCAAKKVKAPRPSESSALVPFRASSFADLPAGVLVIDLCDSD
jgi:hypothetical protein